MHLDSFNTATFVTVISLLITLLAIVLMPIVTYFIAKNQIRVQLLSTAHQRKIEEIRDIIAVFITLSDLIADELGIKVYKEHLEKDQNQRDFDKLYLYINKAKLLIRSNMDDEHSINNLMLEVIKNLKDSNPSIGPYSKAITKLELKSYEILEKEYSKIKKGKF